MSGRWVTVTMSDGTSREDWVPVDQPPTLAGQPGEWHVVTDQAGGGESRWEWHPRAAPVIPPSAWPCPVEETVQAHGLGAVLRFNGSLVTIATGKRGKETAIPLSALTGMLWKPGGAINHGKLEFLGASLGGEFMYKGNTIATPKNPKVLFTRAQQPEFEVVRAAIQAALARR